MRRIAGLFRDLPRTCPRTCPARAARHAPRFTGRPSAVALYLCAASSRLAPSVLDCIFFSRRRGPHLFSPSRTASSFSISSHTLSFLFLPPRRGRARIVSCPSLCRPREGWAERREAHFQSGRACEARQPRLRDAGRPARSGRRLAALHRGDFRPATHAAPSPTVPAGCAPRLARCRAARPGGRGRQPPAAAVRAAAGGRHSPLRLQDVSGDAPHERGWGKSSLDAQGSQPCTRM